MYCFVMNTLEKVRIKLLPVVAQIDVGKKECSYTYEGKYKGSLKCLSMYLVLIIQMYAFT